MMNTSKDAPKTLLGAVIFFSDYENCHTFMVRNRWPGGIVRCPTCGSEHVTYLASARLWKCYAKHERPKFSLKVGTIFEDSPLPLQKWLPAVWMIANCKNGISSYEVSRAIGVTQKSAWFMLHRIRLAMQTGSFLKLQGEVEVDETFVGGKAGNMHEKKRRARITGRGGEGKAIAFGMLQRGGRVKTQVITNRVKETVQPIIKRHVLAGSTLYSDEMGGYRGTDEYDHHFIDHAVEYVRDRVHTNGIENFWSLLKRSIKGTYVSVEPPRWSPENRPSVVGSKPANGGRPGLSCFNLSAHLQASPFSFASFVGRTSAGVRGEEGDRAWR